MHLHTFAKITSLLHSDSTYNLSQSESICLFSPHFSVQQWQNILYINVLILLLAQLYYSDMPSISMLTLRAAACWSPVNLQTAGSTNPGHRHQNKQARCGNLDCQLAYTRNTCQWESSPTLFPRASPMGPASSSRLWAPLLQLDTFATNFLMAAVTKT